MTTSVVVTVRTKRAGGTRRFATGLTVNALGNGLFLTVSALYFTRVGGLSLVAYGVALSVAAGAGLVVGPLVGHLADRVGARRLYSGLLVAQGAGSALYLSAGQPWMLAVLLVLVSVADRGAAATRGAFIVTLVPREARVRFRAVLRSLTNAAGALGAAAGSLVLAWDTPSAYRTAVAVNAITFIVAAVLVALTGRPPSAGRAPPPVALSPAPGPAVPAQPVPARLRLGTAVRDGGFVVITLLNAVLLLHTSMITTALPLWVSERTDAPLWVVSVAVVLNALGVVLLQVPVSRGVQDVPSAARAARRSALLLAVAALALGGTGAVDGGVTVALILVAALAHLGGELLQAAAGWQLAFDLAPDAAQGQYQGVFNAGQDVGALVSPLLFTVVVASMGSGGWVVVAMLFIAAGAAMPGAARWASRAEADR